MSINSLQCHGTKGTADKERSGFSSKGAQVMATKQSPYWRSGLFDLAGNGVLLDGMRIGKQKREVSVGEVRTAD